MAIEWTDTDPVTGQKRYVQAEKFARRWSFKIRFRRRTDWQKVAEVTRDMWETLLDALERRYHRREGVTEEDLKQVRAALAALPPEDEGVSPQRHEASTESHEEDRGQSSEHKQQGAEGENGARG